MINLIIGFLLGCRGAGNRTQTTPTPWARTGLYTTPRSGAGDRNRTGVTSLEGWGNNHYTTPAFILSFKNSFPLPDFKYFSLFLASFFLNVSQSLLLVNKGLLKYGTVIATIAKMIITILAT